ncbi:hypothetical protein C8J57DRAFT_1480372 [Mycena rebaudengoi]|nr:hypothetical protein C8J57DRAFT_1480372 [Mycena rebaudengoi]
MGSLLKGLGFSSSPFFPDHDRCFGQGNGSDICRIPTTTMINFLNISNPDSYLSVYCNNPPVDSCAFGYCPNPDVASPAVRYSAYFSSLVSAILVLYSPEDVESAFFAQLLNVYSLIVAAIISIAGHNLTKLHSVIALTLAASPLSLYLLMYVVRSLMGKNTRLEAVFGKGKILNRVIVLLILPLWIGVLVFTSLSTVTWEFQQAACDEAVADNHIASLFFIPFIAMFVEFPATGIVFVLGFGTTWGIAIWRLRKIIWGKHDRYFPLGRLWRKVVNRYPFIQFCSVIVVPHVIWITNVEVGLVLLSTRERFQATYGQLLAIFVTVPPFIQLCLILHRVPVWFMDLTWVRYVLGHQDRPLLNPRVPDNSALPIQANPGFLGKTEGLPGSSETVPMHNLPYGQQNAQQHQELYDPYTPSVLGPYVHDKSRSSSYN